MPKMTKQKEALQGQCSFVQIRMGDRYDELICSCSFASLLVGKAYIPLLKQRTAATRERRPYEKFRIPVDELDHRRVHKFSKTLLRGLGQDTAIVPVVDFFELCRETFRQLALVATDIHR